MSAKDEASLNDLLDKRRFVTAVEDGPVECRFGRWSLAWEGKDRAVVFVGNGTHTVAIDTLSLSHAPWSRVLAKALEALEPDHWHDQSGRWARSHEEGV